MLAQTVRPRAWTIVSDRSTDETDRVAAAAAEAHDFIRFLRFENPLPPTRWAAPPGRRWSALRAGLATLDDVDPTDYIGNLDADVTFAPAYYATLMERMQAGPDLGIAGGFIYNASDGRPYFVNPEVVGGPIQFFRREAWQQIDDYVPWGQEDAIAQMMARMLGWRIRSFDDLRVLHHKTAKEKSRNPLRGKFHAGKMERAMGYHPLCRGEMLRQPAEEAGDPREPGAALRLHLGRLEEHPDRTAGLPAGAGRLERRRNRRDAQGQLPAAAQAQGS